MNLREVDVGDISPAQFGEHMINHGAIVLRNAVPKAVLEPLAGSVQALLDHYDGISAEVITREIEQLDPITKGAWQQILQDGVHYNMDMIAFSQGRHSLFDPVRKSRLQELAAHSWPDKQARENHITNVRRVFPAERTGYANVPLMRHVDAQFHQHHALGVNFWTPLTGAGIDQPGLAVAPLGVEETRDYLEYSAEGYERTPNDIAFMHHFRCDKLESDEVREWLVAPKLNPGDVLAFTNFTIHATSIEAYMTKPRTSIEIRMLYEDDPNAAPA